MIRKLDEKVIATRSWITATKSGGTLKATAKLHKLGGNQRPYFSLTGEEWSKGGRLESAGCIHDMILKRWPQLKPLAAIHLSDDTGKPMHSHANGWYWMAGALGGAGEQYHGGSGSSGKKPEECLTIWADQVRVPLERAAVIREIIKACRDDASAQIAAERQQWDDAFGPAYKQSYLVSIGLHDDLSERTAAMIKRSWAKAKARHNNILDGFTKRWRDEAEAALRLITDGIPGVDIPEIG